MQQSDAPAALLEIFTGNVLALAIALGSACGGCGPSPSFGGDAGVLGAPTPILRDGGSTLADGGSPVVGADGGPAGVSEGGADSGPPPVCDVLAYGAKGDGTTKNTAAIQMAIDACAGLGGTVRVHDGVYLTGMIQLKSNVVLHIDSTGTILGTQDDNDYPSTNPPTDNTQLKNCRKTLIYAESAANVRIEGTGTIDGNGNTPKWIGPSTLHPEATRPMVVYTALSKNVTIQDVTIKNAAMWALVNLEADDLTIRNVVIDSLLSGNRDGMDIVDCHHVTIEGCTISSEDDAICFKSGARRGVDDATVKNCHVVKSLVANALKLGTASYGGFSNVTFDTITIDGADKAAMAVESVDGADVSNITFKNIVFQNVGSPVFVLLGDRGTTPAGDVHKVGTIDGVHFQNISGKNTRYDWGSPISGTTKNGITYRLKNLSFVDFTLDTKGGLTGVPGDPPEYAGQYPDPNLWGNLPGSAYFIRHADGVTFTHSSPTTSSGDARQPLVARDVTNMTVN